MFKKVFLDDLPKYNSGAHKGKINWQNSINYKVEFIYGDITGNVLIIKYNKQNKKLDVEYNNNIFSINILSFAKCQLGNILDINHYTYNHKYNYLYNIGDIIKTKTGNIKILEQTRINTKNNYKNAYKYECLIDGNISIIDEYILTKGSGCNVCSSNTTLKGINDLSTTHNNIWKLMKYPVNGYKLTQGSKKSEIFICPDCGYEKSFIIRNIIIQGFSCPRCGDGISYPNKFAFNLLEQLNIDFVPEYKFFNYKLDFLF